MKGLISFRVVIESGDQDANEERGAVIAANFAKLPQRTLRLKI